MKTALPALIALLIFNAACDGEPTDLPGSGDPLPTATPASQGLDEAKLADATARIAREVGSRHCTVIVKNGHVVSETYNSGDRNTAHNVQSLSKNLGATLIGVAVTDGLLALDDKVSRYITPPSAMHPEATIRHVISQTSQSADLNRPTFRYDVTGGEVLNSLNDVVLAATGRRAYDYARERLLSRLGISHSRWGNSSTGRLEFGAGASFTCREMAKLGQLYLNNGKWQGDTILSEDFIRQAVRPNYKDANTIYGYTWYLNSNRDNETWKDANAGTKYGKIIKDAGSSFIAGFGFLSQIQLVSRYHNAVVVTLGTTISLDLAHPDKSSDQAWPAVAKAVDSGVYQGPFEGAYFSGEAIP